MPKRKICPECAEPYDDVVLLYYLQSNAVAAGQEIPDTPVYGCPNCQHVCGIHCAHAGEERIPIEPSSA